MPSTRSAGLARGFRGTDDTWMCNPRELWFQSSQDMVKPYLSPVIFLCNCLKTRSPCTVHMALSLVAGKIPFPCISRLNVSLSHHIRVDGMTLPSTTAGLACLMRTCCFSTGRWQKNRRQNYNFEVIIVITGSWSLKLSFDSSALSNVFAEGTISW